MLKLQLKLKYWKSLNETGILPDYAISVIKDQARYNSDEGDVTIDTELLENEILVKIKEWMKSHEDSKTPAFNVGMQIVSASINIHDADTEKGGVYKRLDHLAAGIKKWVLQSEHKWLFSASYDGQLLPHYIESIEYSPAHKDNPADTTIKMFYLYRGKSMSSRICFESGNLGLGMNIKELIEEKGYKLETPALYEGYLRDIELYKKYTKMEGEQFHGFGYASSGNYGGWLSLETDGLQSRLIIDDREEKEDGTIEETRRSSIHVRVDFWEKVKKQIDPNYIESYAASPVHTYIQVFNIQTHEHVRVHVNNIKEYIYDKDLINKLVLDDDVKDILTILIEASGDNIEDIILGKTGGTNMLLTGKPGLGKTLTGEIYAEAIGRPLYTVQCSQLGTNPETIEKKLVRSLRRAVRWKAIMLLDEADVYIRKRGTDIQHNAIVGVFLRVLEYYKGILIMNTNFGDDVDDAIHSRCIVHIKYEVPKGERYVELWTVLMKQYGVEPTPKLVQELISHFPAIGGRDIKQMMKLSKLIANKRKVEIDSKFIIDISKYQNITKHDSHV